MAKTLLAIVIFCLGCARAWLETAPCVHATRARRVIAAAPPLMLAKKKKGGGSSRRAKRQDAAPSESADGSVPDTPLVLAEFAESPGHSSAFEMDKAPLSSMQGEMLDASADVGPMPQLDRNIDVEDEPKLKLPSFDVYARSGMRMPRSGCPSHPHPPHYLCTVLCEQV